MKSIRSFLTSELPVNNKNEIDCTVDELVSRLKKYSRELCKEQVMKVLSSIQFKFNENDEICGIIPQDIEDLIIKIK